MADKKKRPSRLGRGLSSLMATPESLPLAPVDSAPALADTTSEIGPSVDSVGTTSAPVMAAESLSAESDGSFQGLVSLAVSQVRPNPHQPRQAFDPGPLESLAASIKADGLMQPVVVRPGEGDTYELIAGERRWRAAQIAGLKTIPAVVHQIDDEKTAEWALIENLQREDLNPIDKAEAFKRLGEEFGLPHAKIAERVGLERSTVTNLLRLLGLSDFCRGLVRENLLSMGQARAIAGLPAATDQKAIAQRAVREGLSVRQVEAEVRKKLQITADPSTPKPTGGQDANLGDLERQIGQQLGTRVRLKAGRKKGSGTLAIDFFSLEDFDALLARMSVDTE